MSQNVSSFILLCKSSPSLSSEISLLIEQAWLFRPKCFQHRFKTVFAPKTVKTDKDHFPRQLPFLNRKRSRKDVHGISVIAGICVRWKHSSWFAVKHLLHKIANRQRSNGNTNHHANRASKHFSKNVLLNAQFSPFWHHKVHQHHCKTRSISEKCASHFCWFVKQKQLQKKELI